MNGGSGAGIGQPGYVNIGSVEGMTLTTNGLGGYTPAFNSLSPSFTIYNTFNSDNNTSIISFNVSNSIPITQEAYIGGVAATGAGNFGADLVFGQTYASSAYVERMRIDSNGNLGIGTYTLSSRLNVNGGVGIGTSLTNGAYLSGNSAPSGGLIVQGNVGIGTFNPFGGQLIVPTTNGNVGIGSLTPGTALDVNGTVRMTGFQLTGNGAGANNMMVSNAVGVGTWMATTTLPIAIVSLANTNDVTFYSATNAFSGGSGFQTNGTNSGSAQADSARPRFKLLVISASVRSRMGIISS